MNTNEETLRDKKKLLKLLQEGINKISRSETPKLTEIKEETLEAFEMLKAWATGTYQQVPWKALLLLVGGLIYFINPFDAIPDFLPGGLVDDATILVAILKSIQAEVRSYRLWKKEQEEDPPAESASNQ